jgi:hypothetical protein
MITFQYENWSDCVDEMRLLWPEHWSELALNKDDIKLNCDEEKFREGERLGCLHIVTARYWAGKGKCGDPACPCPEGACNYEGDIPFPPYRAPLVGYYYGMLMNHLHYKDAGLMCYSDAYYLKPEHRGMNGARFLSAIMRSLKLRGVVKLYISTKAHQDHSALFERFGMKLSDRLFTRML